MITYKVVKSFKSDFLKGYKRFTKTTKMFINVDQELIEKDTEFIDDWDETKLNDITMYFKDLHKQGGTIVCAFDKQKVVGFMTIDHYSFDEYVNIPYVHVSKDYRGHGIGKKLFLITSLIAINQGYKKLYISCHPSIETISFYQSVGCVVTKNINDKLLALEPLDIQMEYVLDTKNIVFDLVRNEFKQYKVITSKEISKVANSLYQFLPYKEELFLNLCKSMIHYKKEYGYFSIGTLWLKKRTSVINQRNMDFFEEIVLNELFNWAHVDQFCYRVMNPMIELTPSNYCYLDKWSNSDNKNVRRVSLVSMIYTDKGGLKTRYDLNHILTLCDRLKDDDDIHVRKAVGWVLKCAFVTYPKDIEFYLRKNVKTLDRLIFRYALEHVKDPLRKELMSL